MASAAQILANRANAQKSTGPRTVEGKTASSLNAFKHGADAASVVLPGEDPAEYDRIVAEYHRDVQPACAHEEHQVRILIHSDWQRRRLEVSRTTSIVSSSAKASRPPRSMSKSSAIPPPAGSSAESGPKWPPAIALEPAPLPRSAAFASSKPP
jgi:hypothetical protein